ncbi:unnamed protein product, partial [Ectocarpus sp. 4 AP-2014]
MPNLRQNSQNARFRPTFCCTFWLGGINKRKFSLELLYRQVTFGTCSHRKATTLRNIQSSSSHNKSFNGQAPPPPPLFFGSGTSTGTPAASVCARSMTSQP